MSIAKSRQGAFQLPAREALPDFGQYMPLASAGGVRSRQLRPSGTMASSGMRTSSGVRASSAARETLFWRGTVYSREYESPLTNFNFMGFFQIRTGLLPFAKLVRPPRVCVAHVAGRRRAAPASGLSLHPRRRGAAECRGAPRPRSPYATTRKGSVHRRDKVNRVAVGVIAASPRAGHGRCHAHHTTAARSRCILLYPEVSRCMPRCI